MQQAEREVERLTARRDELATSLSAPDLDHEARRRLGEEAATVATALDAAEEAWLTLADDAGAGH